MINEATTSMALLCATPSHQHLQSYSSYSHLNTTWINNPQLAAAAVAAFPEYYLPDQVQRPILLRNASSGYGSFLYACGFFCNGSCDSFLFGVSILPDMRSYLFDSSFQVVWSANGNHPVRENATLELTSSGDLVLRDVDGALVWSTHTSSQGITRLEIEETGNLRLIDSRRGNATNVWQSFDHPTNTLLLGQTLPAGRKLTARVSTSNYTEAPFYLSVEKEGMFLYAFAPYDQPQRYWSPGLVRYAENYRDIPYAVYSNTSIDVFLSNDHHNTQPDVSVPLPYNTSRFSMTFLRIDPDGILRVYGWSDTLYGWAVAYDVLAGVDPCFIPGTCGLYGLCTPPNAECLCFDASFGNSTLSTDSFTPINPLRPAEGCIPRSGPLFCESENTSAHDQHFLEVPNVDYGGRWYNVGNVTASLDECKLRCLQACSCKAAFFLTGVGTGVGTCFAVTEVYTVKMISTDLRDHKMVGLFKIQNPGKRVKTSKKPVTVGISTSASVVVVIVTLALMVLLCRRRALQAAQNESPFFDKVPGLPSRFTYRDLRHATHNFRDKLGAGGFGTVFLGVLADGEQVAVKRLESSRQGHKEFLAEVCTIGSIHHLNLVRLCGFCAEREHRLLVYEFMPNGSLDRWIFGRTNALLDWSTRVSVALGTAQGLAYLHEECRERILHFDVKPQNILLDDHFQAKVADFGLSKFMGRDQSQVVTTMRGTPGYMAPEWLHSTVTQKADVYSFGIVLLEIVSGRKCLDLSLDCSDPNQPTMYLPAWANLKAQEGGLLQLVDCRLGDNYVEEEAVRTINVALSCIQDEPAKRPAMSSVVQMLEGVLDLTPVPLALGHVHSEHLQSSNGTDNNSWAQPPKDSISPAVHLSAPR